MSHNRTTFALTLVDAGKSKAPPTQRLGLACKVLLRSFGFRVVSMSETKPAASPVNQGPANTTEEPCEG